MNKKINIDKIFELIIKEDAPRSIFVNFMEAHVGNPYIVLIACILSLRTKDETTYPATVRMLELAQIPHEMAKIDVEKLAKAIYPVGFYRNKAEQIINLSKELVEKYNSKVPCDIDEIVKFKGVGRKTANLVMSRGFDVPAICVDVHVHRIFNRIGFLETKEPDETEMVLRDKLPKKYWQIANTILVTHGQNTCKPINPACERCVIKDYCQKKILVK